MPHSKLLTHRNRFNSAIAIILIAAVVIVGVKIVFFSYASGPTDPAIPDTAYAIPSGAVFMATNGNDAASGSQSAPVKTISRALALVPAGGTVVVRAGTYRDGSTASISKAVTFQAYPHEQAWFDGTDQVTSWTSAGSNQWSVAWNTPSFCSGHYYDLPYNQQTQTGPCAFLDEYGAPANPAAGDPQMVFLDGTYVHEVTSKAAATGNNFFYDQTAKQLYIGFNPSGHTVELAARPSALVFQGGSGNVTVRGLGFRRYASNNYNGNATHGAILANVPHSTFENDVFAQMAGAGLSMVDPRSGVVRGTTFYQNGSNGFDSNGHQHSTGEADNLVMENNDFDGNNAENFGPGCGYSCMAAGSKLAHMDGFTLKNNIFQNQFGAAKGFWCDLACSRGVMVDNVFKNNGDAGLMYEVSDTGIIASNLIVNNGSYGLKIGASNTKVYNNTLVGNNVGALIYDDSRTYGVSGWTDVGPDTVNLDFSNNIIASGHSTSVQSWRTATASPNTGPNTFYSGYDYNSYFRSGTSPAIAEWKETSTTDYPTLAGFTSAHAKEQHGQDITSGSDPFFVNVATGDYRVRAGSVAKGSGKALPADVAAAVGVAAGQAVDRGALIWPGMGGTVTPTPTATKTPTPTPTPTRTLTPTPTAVPGKPGDTNGDGKVNITDLSVLLSHWNASYAAADFNGDGKVNITDLSILLSHWTG